MRKGYYWAKTKRDGMWVIVERFDWGWSYSNDLYHDNKANNFNKEFEVYYYIGTNPHDNIISLKT